MQYQAVVQQIARAGRNNEMTLDLSREKLTLLPPEIEQLRNLNTLNLNNNLLTTLPSEIGHLSLLRNLYLNGNLLTTLPSNIGDLKKLVRLRLGENQITELPPEIKELSRLKQLDLKNNELMVLPAGFGKLSTLIELDLSENLLDVFPAEILQLTNLLVLDLSMNRLTRLPPEIKQLKSLRELYLGENQLTELPRELCELKNLKKLCCSIKGKFWRLSPEDQEAHRSNHLTVLPTGIEKLKNLTELDLRYNELVVLPPEIKHLKSLTELDLRHNKLTELPPEIGELTNLRRLSLSHNNLTALPQELARLTNLEELDLRNNALPLPPEILRSRPAAILNYYLKHRAGERQPLNEAKMVLVGQGSVGKTSLVRRLLEKTFDSHEPQTKGIDIQRWQVEVDAENIRLNVWDFGGQEIMHATHQFFLTQRSLYLLVLDARLDDNENRVEYWLKLIQSFGGDSPIIIVGNKIDQRRLDIDRSGLRKKYPTIKAVVETSCETGEGLEELETAITEEVGRLPHIHDELLNTWFEVKMYLEEMEDDYISLERYRQMCEEQDITETLSRRTLLGFLHDLGIVLTFQDDPRLQELGILNPEWVTNGVYKILNARTVFDNGGRLDISTLDEILDPEEYPEDKHMFIMNMMRKFELCYNLDPYGARDEKFLIPDLLPKEEPYTGEWDEALAFQYHYDVLPGSIITRLIVRMHRHISQNTAWRNGVVLTDRDNRALVKADKEDKKIFIRIIGPEAGRRPFLAIIRSRFDDIHATISRIEADEKVPLPDHPDLDPVDYGHLLNLEEMGKETFVPEGLREEINVKQLLDGVEAEQERLKRRVTPKNEHNAGEISETDRIIEINSEEETKRRLRMYGGVLATLWMAVGVLVAFDVVVLGAYIISSITLGVGLFAGRKNIRDQIFEKRRKKNEKKYRKQLEQ